MGMVVSVSDSEVDEEIIMENDRGEHVEIRIEKDHQDKKGKSQQTIKENNNMVTMEFSEAGDVMNKEQNTQVQQNNSSPLNGLQ